MLEASNSANFTLEDPALITAMQPDMALSFLSGRSGNDVGPTIYVDSPASDAPRERRRQVCAGETHIHDVDKFTEGCLLGSLIEQQFKVFQSRCGSCLQWTRRNRMHSDTLWAKLVG